MCKCLPYWKQNCVNDFDLNKILTTPYDNNNTGCIIEVDLHFPIELHNASKEYPPAPETLTPKLEWLSYYQTETENKSGDY